MTVYRVEVDGATVHTATTKKYEGLTPFGDYLKRPAETPDGEPNLSPAYLYVDDELVGIQRSHADEAEQCEIAAAWLYAGSLEPADPDPDKPGPAQLAASAQAMKSAAADARHYARKALGG